MQHLRDGGVAVLGFARIMVVADTKDNFLGQAPVFGQGHTDVGMIVAARLPFGVI